MRAWIKCFCMCLLINVSYAASISDLSQQSSAAQKSSVRAAQSRTLANTPMKMISQVKDPGGYWHIRSQQTYQGIPIWNYQIIEHQGDTESSYTGYYVYNIDQDLKAIKTQMKSASEVLAWTKAYHVKMNPTRGVLSEGEAKPFIYLDDEHIAHKIYQVVFMLEGVDEEQPSLPTYLVDAYNLTIYKSWDGMMHAALGQGPGGNKATGRYEYGLDPQFAPFDIAVKGKACHMENAAIRTVNLNHAEKGSTPYAYACNPVQNQYYHDEGFVNGAYGVLNDAHTFGNAIIAMYRDWYGISPLPIQLVMRVHYGTDYANAMWNPYTKMMSFGDGDEEDFYPLVTIDIAAHEVAHGITQYASNLVYSGQSGGLNESFSDMTAQAAEYYLYGENDWMIGANIMKAGGALRYMNDPMDDGYSIDNASDYYDDMDVHLSSGVFNKAFYMLSTRPGWDLPLAYTVFYYANLTQWQPDEGFASAACGTVRAATALQAYEPAINVQDVITVFAAVGIYYDAASQTCRI